MDGKREGSQPEGLPDAVTAATSLADAAAALDPGGAGGAPSAPPPARRPAPAMPTP